MVGRTRLTTPLALTTILPMRQRVPWCAFKRPGVSNFRQPIVFPKNWIAVCPEGDLTNHIRFIAEYEDGSSDVFAVPECTLDQGPMPIARIVAREWQTDGYLKPGKIVGVRRLTTEEFMSVLLA